MRTTLLNCFVLAIMVSSCNLESRLSITIGNGSRKTGEFDTQKTTSLKTNTEKKYRPRYKEKEMLIGYLQLGPHAFGPDIKLSENFLSLVTDIGESELYEKKYRYWDLQPEETGGDRYFNSRNAVGLALQLCTADTSKLITGTNVILGKTKHFWNNEYWAIVIMRSTDNNCSIDIQPGLFQGDETNKVRQFFAPRIWEKEGLKANLPLVFDNRIHKKKK